MNAAEKAEAALKALRTEGIIAAGMVANESKRLSKLAAFWFHILSTFHFIWKTFVKPVYKFLYSAYDYLFWSNFRKVWDRYAYNTNIIGEKKLSVIKGTSIILSTITTLVVVYGFVFLMADTTLYFLTASRNEIVYLSNAQEISHADNLHSAQGCVAPETTLESDTEFNCSDANSLYFRVDNSLFNQLWSLIHHRTIFYPDYVSAAIAPGWHKCTITSYGFRAKFFVRNWDIYPHLLSASCKNEK